jgi:hypothetical protein
LPAITGASGPRNSSWSLPPAIRYDGRNDHLLILLSHHMITQAAVPPLVRPPHTLITKAPGHKPGL